VLEFRHEPSLIVVVTDGEETCGGSPCDLGKQLHAAAEQLTIHVIGYRPKGFSWTGEQSLVDAKCLADQNGGLYIAAETKGRPDLGSRKDARLPDGDAAGMAQIRHQLAYNATVYVRCWHEADKLDGRCSIQLLTPARAHTSAAWRPLAGSTPLRKSLGRSICLTRNFPWLVFANGSELAPIRAMGLCRAAIKVGALLNSKRLVMNIANDMRLRL
jgi:hypothetical protein